VFARTGEVTGASNNTADNKTPIDFTLLQLIFNSLSKLRSY